MKTYSITELIGFLHNKMMMQKKIFFSTTNENKKEFSSICLFIEYPNDDFIFDIFFKDYPNRSKEEAFKKHKKNLETETNCSIEAIDYNWKGEPLYAFFYECKCLEIKDHIIKIKIIDGHKK